jgi:hypothetical protein
MFEEEEDELTTLSVGSGAGGTGTTAVDTFTHDYTVSDFTISYDGE